MARPEGLVGRAVEQVDRFLEERVAPVLGRGGGGGGGRDSRFESMRERVGLLAPKEWFPGDSVGFSYGN